MLEMLHILRKFVGSGVAGVIGVRGASTTSVTEPEVKLRVAVASGPPEVRPRASPINGPPARLSSLLR